MAPSWGTSCLRSKRRILSTVSMRGERPPWTQRTAPPLLEREPLLELEAEVPDGPVLEEWLLGLMEGEGGGEEAMGSWSRGRRRLRGKRDVISFLEFMISISTTSSPVGNGRAAKTSGSMPAAGSRVALVPRTRAPRAR